LSLRQNAARFKAEAGRVIDDFRGSAAIEKFDIFARAYYLRHTWKLEPELMKRVNQMYGPTDFRDGTRLPLDWRHPCSHGIYWAVKGLEAASREKASIAEINTDRIVNHCLQDLFRYGKMFFYVSATRSGESTLAYDESEITSVYLRPDLRMFDAYNKSSLERIEKYEKVRTNTYDSLMNGHKNMLVNALLAFYQAGHIPKAQEIYNELKRLFPEREEFKAPLLAFARDRWREELRDMTITNAQEAIATMLRESYFRYAMRDDDESAAREKLAQEVYDYYMSLNDEESRIDLPDFKLLRYFSLLDFFNDEQYPVELRQSLVARIKVERPDIAEQFKSIEMKLLEEQGATVEEGQ
jgi:hypothetical protein